MNLGAGLSTPLSTGDEAAFASGQATETVGKGVDNPCSKFVLRLVGAQCGGAARFWSLPSARQTSQNREFCSSGVSARSTRIGHLVPNCVARTVVNV